MTYVRIVGSLNSSEKSVITFGKRKPNAANFKNQNLKKKNLR